MSALSVLSSIVPTAPGGTASASPEAAASDGLFAGMVAAVASPSTATATSDEGETPDIPAAESDVLQTSDLAAAVVAAPIWPPLPLIAPARLPVAPDTAADAAAAAGAGAAMPPLSAAPLSNTPPLDAASSLPKAPTAPAAPLGAEPVEPAQNLQSGQTAQPTADRTTQGPVMAEAARPAPAVAETGETIASPRPAGVETAPLAPRQAAPSAQPTPPAASEAVAPPPAPSSASSSVAAEATEPRQDAAAQTRTVPEASSQPAATATRAAPPLAATASQSPAQAPTAPPVEAVQPPKQAAPAATAPGIPPQTLAATQPVAVPPAKVAEQVAEQVAAAPITPSDPEGEVTPVKAPQAPPQTAPGASPAPATAAPAPPQPVPQTATRNNGARLDDRPSNAASSDTQTGAPTDAPTAAKGEAAPRAPHSAAAAQPTTPPAGDSAAAKPVAPIDAAPLDARAAQDAAPLQPLLDAQSAAPTTSRDLGLSQLSRATVETTAQIAAQILKKLDGRSTRFDMALTPDDLGRVDVSMEIDSDGRLTARLAFDNPAAATDLRARADELRRQLQDAGFQLTQDSLEFSERNPSSGFGGGGAFDRAPDRRAFAGAARLAVEADSALPAPGPWASLSQTRDRVDLKV